MNDRSEDRAGQDRRDQARPDRTRDLGDVSDMEKAEWAADQFEHTVAPLLTRYLELKAKGADPLTQWRAQRAYEKAHGRHNVSVADHDAERPPHDVKTS